ncbi:MFS transporter [Thalassospira profundimaris]|uniref:MFS transporter n=1 Tax=Thalassospira profundimaris TaxID=502049 RepID=A0A367WQ16_9PROT|nr:MFS transporter [Thalassospira profundimaris]RCK43299.1 MFS transporter [Thalassospira profundimaris]
MAGKPNRLTQLCYATPALAAAIPTIPAYILLPSLYGDTLGLGLTLTGMLFFVIRLIDMFTDPLVGYLSDHTKTRKPWVIAGAVLAGIGIWFLFNPPAAPSGFYLFGWASLLFIGWTMFQVPYLAWGAELSGDYDQRGNISALREGTGLVGILLAGAVPVVAGINAPLAQTSLLGNVTLVVGVLGVLILALFVPDMLRNKKGVQGDNLKSALTAGAGRKGQKPEKSPSRFDQVRAGLAGLWQNRLFVRLLCAWLINGLANGLPAVCFPLFVRYGLDLSPADQNILILLYFAVAVIAMPVWVMLGGRFGRPVIWCWAMVAAIVAFVFVPVLGQGDFIGFAVICAVTGAALGADLALPPAIQADVDDWDHYRFGASRTGLLFALWNMTNKLALALAAGVAFPVLGAVGLNTGGVMAQSGTAEANQWALGVLVVIYAIVPVVLKIMAVAMMWRFPLGRRHQLALRRRLDRRMS